MKLVNHLLSVMLLGSACSAAFAAGTDDLWEMNIVMNMGGHSMPLQTMNSCMTKGQDHPAPPDKSCKVTNQGGLVGKGSMLMECAGPPPSTIKIEGTRSANTMKGTMTVISGGTTLVQEFSGKIVGNCDAATFVQSPPAGISAGAGMPPAMMKRPSFDSATRPTKQSALDAAAANPANAAEPVQLQEPVPPPAPDNSNKTLDAAKKALGGLFSF